MSENRFAIVHKEFLGYPQGYAYIIRDNSIVCEPHRWRQWSVWEDKEDVEDLCGLLNEQQATINQLKEENMDLRAKHTQMIIIMKDVVKDLKRIDTYRYAEHLEKIANLHFLSEKELEDE